MFPPNPSRFKTRLAVCAANNSALSTSTFTGAGVVPAGWLDADIGAPSFAGSASCDGRTWRVSGGGADASYAFAFLTPANPQPFAGAIFECRKGTGRRAPLAG